MTAEVYRGSRGREGVSGSCLRLLAQPDLRAAVPARLPWHTVIVDSPPVPVAAGDVVRISGRIRLVSARPGSLDGGVIEDTLGGPGAGLHCRRPGGWRRFELLRRVDRGQDMRIRVALEGVGELRVDDLQVEPAIDEGVGFLRIVGQHPNLGQAQVLQQLDTDAVVPHVGLVA